MDLSAGGGIGQRLRDPRPSPLSFLYRRFRAPAQGTDDRAGQNGRGSQHGASQSVGSISDIQQKFPGVRQQQRRRRPGTSGAATGLAQTQEASPIRTNEYRRNRYRKGRGATGNQARALPLGSLGADGGASSANPQDHHRLAKGRRTRRPGTTGGSGHSLHAGRDSGNRGFPSYFPDAATAAAARRSSSSSSSSSTNGKHHAAANPEGSA